MLSMPFTRFPNTFPSRAPQTLSKAIMGLTLAMGLSGMAGCDRAIQISPDARLPDGSVYSGDVENGLFEGKGVQIFPGGERYEGDFHSGQWDGTGRLSDSEDGWEYLGEFQEGTMHGLGRYTASDGGVYLARFERGKPVEGRHETEYGVYEGEFRDWYYHGSGTWTTTGGEAVSGRFEWGTLADNSSADQSAGDATQELINERILAEDAVRFAGSLAQLKPQNPGETDIGFLAVGGDGNESVFGRDIARAWQAVSQWDDIRHRTLLLLNDREYRRLPLATPQRIRTALKALDQRLDPEEDLLFIHLVSHGARDGRIALDQPGMSLPDLAPEQFAEMISELNVRRKIIVVSACFSGNWIEPLADDDHWILTSARSDRTSFGCGDDSEMTWFTRALYDTSGFDLTQPGTLYESVSKIIRETETEQGIGAEDWSYPQHSLGTDIGDGWLHRHLTERENLLP